MAMMLSDVSKIEWGKRALYANAGSENLSLRLFSNNITPSETDVAGTFTEATFTSYAAKTLTSSQSGATWGVPAVTVSPAVIATYGTAQTWTPGSSQTIYGWYMTFSSSGTLAASELFAAPRALDSTTTLTLTPKMQISHI